jgi:hypothetical protein
MTEPWVTVTARATPIGGLVRPGGRIVLALRDAVALVVAGRATIPEPRKEPHECACN